MRSLKTFIIRTNYKILFFLLLLLLNDSASCATSTIPDEPMKALEKALEVLMEKAKDDPRMKVILVSTGSYNPVHRMHLGMFDAARAFLEKSKKDGGPGFHVILGLLSPSCDSYLQDKMVRYGGKVSDAISFDARFAMCKGAVQEHDKENNGRNLPIRVHGWEGWQKGFVDFPEVTEHIREEVNEKIQEKFLAQQGNVIVLYLCGMDHYDKCGLASGKHVIALNRGTDLASKIDTKKHNYIAPAPKVEFADLSSTEMRKRRDLKQSVVDLTFQSVAQYLQDNLGWENAAKALEHEGPAGKALKDLRVLKKSLVNLQSKLGQLHTKLLQLKVGMGAM